MGAIFLVNVPATIIKSAWRGEGRNISEPNRAMSHEAAETIISMAQQASPMVTGHTEDFRPQLTKPSSPLIKAVLPR
jgi:hypothetical protein